VPASVPRRATTFLSDGMSEQASKCRACSLARSENSVAEGIYPVTKAWTLRTDLETTTHPCFVLQSAVHAEQLSEMSGMARHELGPLLAAMVSVVPQVTGAMRIEIQYPDPAVPRHVLFRFVPILEAEHLPSDHLHSDHIPAAISRGESTSMTARVAAAIYSNRSSLSTSKADAPIRSEPSTLVNSVLAIVRLWSHASLYRYAFRIWPLRRLRVISQAEVYVAGWLALLTAIFVLSPETPGSGWQYVIVAICSYRYVDLLTYYVGILLDRSANSLQSYMRSLVLLALNVGELVLILGLAFRILFPGIGRPTALLDAFDVVTLRAPAPGPGTVPHFVGALAIIAALTLLVGGVTVVLGLISARFREQST
jgi:hypothetical protein